MAEMSRRIFAVASLAAGASVATGESDAKEQGDISLDNAAIHQERVFHAKPGRIYRILTTDEFDKVVQLSAAMGAMKSMHGTHPTMIDATGRRVFVFRRIHHGAEHRTRSQHPPCAGVAFRQLGCRQLFHRALRIGCAG